MKLCCLATEETAGLLLHLEEGVRDASPFMGQKQSGAVKVWSLRGQQKQSVKEVMREKMSMRTGGG
jgi:hypothetical protein